MYALLKSWDFRPTVMVVLSAAMLAACSSVGRKPPPHAPVEAADLPEGGIYKVGNPYQIDGVWYYPSEDYSYVEEGVASWYGPDFHGKKTANGERYDMNALTAAHPTLPMPSVVNVTNLANGRQIKLRINDRGPFKSNRVIDVSRRAAQLLDFQQAGTTRVRIQIDATESLTIKNMMLARSPGELPKVNAAPSKAIASAPLDPPPPTSAAQARTPPRASSRNVARSNLPPVAERPARVAEAKPQQLPAGLGVYIQAGAFADSGNAKRLMQQMAEFGHAFVVTVTINAQQLFRVRLGPLQDDEGANELLNRIKSFGYDDAQIVRY
ncbi:MAG: septal ring lytic transglycosylase RlpA family protein [Alphaproteobacteria bacterium]|nr:septal ring lytic transglycosylase RlpA family protein [Alphaproteobacteria bacterium]